MLPSRRATVLLTAATAVIFVTTSWSVAGPPDRAPLLYVLLVAANTAPLLAVRRNPLAVVAVFSVAFPLWVDAAFGTAALQSLPALVALYATGAWDRPLWLRALALLAPAWMMAAGLMGLWVTELLTLGYVALVFTMGWGLGVVVAGRHAYVTELEARTQQLDVLTAREVDVLEQVAAGLSNREISARLHISELTTKTHVSRILTKLHLDSRVQAAVLAYETGLIRPAG